jgi:ubiquinone/menaquinone biosynthesis C-methylase UbiE
MGFYEKRIFPRLLDWTMRKVEPLRDRAVAAARGDVLEIGFGTGLNLPHYPPAVRSLVGVDPLDGLHARVRDRIAAVEFPVEQVKQSAEASLPFEDGRFDCVVSVFTLCTIPDLTRALAEAQRVLKRDGLFLYFEHGLSDDPRTARWQQRLNGIHRKLTCGCQMIRPIDRLVEDAGFTLRESERWVEPDGPRVLSEFYRGIATPTRP